ncbi:MAG: PEP-CTERM sorting domain-containing protein [FCB group bacterium]|nr:PEP-CTERM sorting domain-containing protein [FCB group bacterium]
MKLMVVLIVFTVLLIVGSAQAALHTMDFTNATLDLGSDVYTGLSTQYSGFGLTFSNIYRYHGKLDSFDEFGITTGELSNIYLPSIEIPDPVKDPPPPPPDPVILFSTLTDFVEFDYYNTVTETSIEITARDISDNIIGSFIGSGKGLGRIDAVGIHSLVFQRSGHAGISTLMYDRPSTAAIPEPGTFILFGLSLIGLKLRKYRR